MPNYIRIKIRRGSNADWAAANPVLELGEIAADMTKHLLKVGNGVSAWNALPYYAIEVVDDLTTGGTEKALSAEQGKVLKKLIDNISAGGGATITVGTTTTGAAGTSASVTNVGTSSAAVLNFTIPKGDKGDKGATGATGAKGADGVTPTIQVGTVTTGAPGSSASVTAYTSGTTTTLNFTIPRGATGAAGSGSSGSSVELVDDLDHTDTDKALTANQGKVLGDKIKGMGIFGMGYTVEEIKRDLTCRKNADSICKFRSKIKITYRSLTRA
ncbi:MAG: hypothetical protein IJP54_05635 [Synergistaceae bacterium]|nr:hypothetical protein [Synergistaceae bacterium]MBR0035136.1 hypothetical protein [Synergistaceae bacterium]